MSKPPTNWPPGALPCRLDAERAAFHVGISKTKFLQGVAAGRYPQPVRDGARKLWVTRELTENAENRGVDDGSGMSRDGRAGNPWDRSLAHAGKDG